MNKGINVISAFDGLAGGLVALKRAGIKVNKYYAFEIDKYAIQIATKNHPEIREVGDINCWEDHVDNFEIPDLIIAGSPCQGFSVAGRGLNFDDPRSKLFFVFVDMLNYWKSKNPNLKFLLENVRMKAEWKDIISQYMDVEPIEINSALVSAQNRKRLYWTNIEGVTQPEDRGFVLRDVLEENVHEKYLGGYNPSYKTQSNSLHETDGKSNVICAGTHGYALGYIKRIGTATDINGHDILKRVYSEDGKSPTLDAQTGGNRQPKVDIRNYSEKCKKQIRKNSKTVDEKSIALTQNSNVTGSGTTTVDMLNGVHYRKLTPLECERLQTLDDNYTEGVSNTQRYKMIGNGWTIEVIRHIFSFLPEFYFK